MSFYYLNSRYYDPYTCRFISADSYVSTGQGFIGNNMYAYCGNNPVMFVDPNGDFAFCTTFLCAGLAYLIQTAIVATTAYVVVDVVIEASWNFGQKNSKSFSSTEIDYYPPQSIALPIEEDLDAKKSSSNEIKEIYDPNPYARPGEKKQNRENRTKARKQDGWEPRNNRRDGKPAKIPKHTPSKKGHKKYFIVEKY